MLSSLVNPDRVFSIFTIIILGEVSEILSVFCGLLRCLVLINKHWINLLLLGKWADNIDISLLLVDFWSFLDKSSADFEVSIPLVLLLLNRDPIGVSKVVLLLLLVGLSSDFSTIDDLFTNLFKTLS